MPDDAAFHSLAQLPPNRIRREELLIPHDMLFKDGHLFAFGVLDLPLNVCEPIFEQEQEPQLRQHRRQYRIRRRRRAQVRHVFGIMADRNAIAMRENLLFDRRPITACPRRGHQSLDLLLLAEDIEESVRLGVRSVERALNRNAAFVVVFLIVREDHQLRDVQERTKRAV